MFDVGFSEIMVIGVVALVVLGPERLPKVARTAGHLFGRMQRYVADVKQQVKAEMDAEDIKQFQTQVQEVKDAVGGVEQSIHSESSRAEQSLLKAIDHETLSSLEFVEEPVAHETTRPASSPQMELPLAAEASPAAPAPTDKPA